ncbi:MAG TPA: phosphotransferase [Streptosporangiaceae bacterium]|nr:phosphotransferase [Streptosporangiaceae bacterium]
MTQSPLEDLLSAWLPAQRWFAGSGSLAREIEITSDVQLAGGDPELRHLMVDVWVGQEIVSYQVLLGLRGQLPPDLAAAVIGTVADGRVAYDGARDPELTAVLLRGIAAQRRAGPLRFEAEPGAHIDDTAAGRTLPALASNTSIVFGDKAILKLLRRPFTGHHPDLEVPAALARNGSKLVAAPLGWIEMPDAGQSMAVQATTGAPGHAAAGAPAGEPAVLAILSVFFANSSDGWSLATASLRLAEPDFSREARLLGEATAKLHAELAEAFGTSVLSRFALTDLIDAMDTELTQAIQVVPRLREYEAGIRACYASLAKPVTEVAVQRIHGDYHLAQVLGTDGGWVVLDFEGEPSVPLARRRAFAPALRDVAGMLRSFDYAARHQATQARNEQRARQAAEQVAAEQVAAEWVRRCQDAFCTGYANLMGADPRSSGPLLRALTLQKAVYEAVYEARHRPDWLPIPLAAIAEASR